VRDFPIPGLGLARAIAAGFVRATDPLVGGGPSSGGGSASAAAAPEYVDYGALMTPPAPFKSMDTELWGFWARADGDHLTALCDKVFREPTGGAVRCRPLSRYLMITWGRIGQVDSMTPPYDRRGGVGEPQVAIWVPVAVRDPTSSRERFAMFIPYLWLSNPMSLATGRELFGYPKSGGKPEFPDVDGGPQTWKLSVFGLDYGPGNLADWDQPLLEVVQGDAVEGAEDELDSLFDVASHAAGEIFTDDDLVGDAEIGLSLAEDILRDLPNVFLKQFRSVQDGLLVAFQQVTQADYEITRLSARPVLNEHRLTVHKLDSHPVTAELGLDDQTLGPAYRVEMDFNVGSGHVLWDGASR
jgi:acetoacetate decarboxylase